MHVMYDGGAHQSIDQSNWQSTMEATHLTFHERQPFFILRLAALWFFLALEDLHMHFECHAVFGGAS